MSFRNIICDFLFESDEESSEIPMTLISDIKTPIESPKILFPKECKNCGTQIVHDTSLFCDNCGFKLSTSQQGITQSEITPPIIQPSVDDKRTSIDLPKIDSTENKVNTQTDHGNELCKNSGKFYFLESAFLFVVYIFNNNWVYFIFALLCFGGGLYIFSNRQSPKECAYSRAKFSIFLGVALLLQLIIFPATDQVTKIFIIFLGLIALVSGAYDFIQHHGGL